MVDVGSGTGIFTRQLRALLPAVTPIVGIEPAPDMRLTAEAMSSGIHGISYVDGLAQRLPIPSGQARAVVAATAAHWFDRPLFYEEARRVLPPGASSPSSSMCVTSRDHPRPPWWWTFSPGMAVREPTSIPTSLPNCARRPASTIWNTDPNASYRSSQPRRLSPSHCRPRMPVTRSRRWASKRRRICCWTWPSRCWPPRTHSVRLHISSVHRAPLLTYATCGKVVVGARCPYRLPHENTSRGLWGYASGKTHGTNKK